jgi:integrase
MQQKMSTVAKEEKMVRAERKVVEPIREKGDIEAVAGFLERTNKRNFVIFTLGINVGLRVSDILALNAADVKGKNRISIREKKTGKAKTIQLNDKVVRLLGEYVEGKEPDQPLFIGKKRKRLDRSQVYRFLNDACKEVGITANIGTHTMRKTFAGHMFNKYGNIALLQTVLNHASQDISLRYIGFAQDELDACYKNFEL